MRLLLTGALALFQLFGYNKKEEGQESKQPGQPNVSDTKRRGEVSRRHDR